MRGALFLPMIGGHLQEELLPREVYIMEQAAFLPGVAPRAPARALLPARPEPDMLPQVRRPRELPRRRRRAVPSGRSRVRLMGATDLITTAYALFTMYVCIYVCMALRTKPRQEPPCYVLCCFFMRR